MDSKINNELLQSINSIFNFVSDFKDNDFFRKDASRIISIDDLPDDIPEIGLSIEDVLSEFKTEYLSSCVDFSSPKFMGFPDSGNSIYGLCAALISDLLQQNLINSTFCSPVATMMEIAIIQWLRKSIGYKTQEISNILDVGGIITTGGTTSNAIAMLLAREHHVDFTMQNGVVDPKRYKVVVPRGIGHYSISASLQWIGCGRNVIEVPTLGFRYSLPELEKILISEKDYIMAVVVYAGDSRTMTIEHIDAVCDTVRKICPNTWIHADACNGFCLSFSEKLKSNLLGIDACDSITMDPHKMLQLPYTASCLLVKEPKTMGLVKSTSDLIMNEDFAFGQITPFIGSKAWVSLKLWFVLRGQGKNGLQKLIDNRYALAQELKLIIEQDEEFILINSVQALSVCFVYIKQNWSTKTINKVNREIYKMIKQDGEYYLHQFSVTDDLGVIEQGATLYPLRFFSGNSDLRSTHLKEMMKYISSKAKIAERNVIYEKSLYRI